MENIRIIVHSSDQLGQAGPNGERLCVFIRDIANPLNSSWTWVNTDQEANKLIDTYSKHFPGSEEIFFQGFAEGQEYEVGCWINEKTKVRF